MNNISLNLIGMLLAMVTSGNPSKDKKHKNTETHTKRGTASEELHGNFVGNW